MGDARHLWGADRMILDRQRGIQDEVEGLVRSIRDLGFRVSYDQTVWGTYVQAIGYGATLRSKHIEDGDPVPALLELRESAELVRRNAALGDNVPPTIKRLLFVPERQDQAQRLCAELERLCSLAVHGEEPL